MKRHRIELQSPRHGSESKESPGVVEARRALEARKGKPDAADAPPLRTFAGSCPSICGGLLRENPPAGGLRSGPRSPSLPAVFTPERLDHEASPGTPGRPASTATAKRKA